VEIPSISSPLACYTPPAGSEERKETFSSRLGKALLALSHHFPSANPPPNTFSSFSSTLSFSPSLSTYGTIYDYTHRLRWQSHPLSLIAISLQYSLTASKLWTPAALVSIHSLFPKRRSTIESVASSATSTKHETSLALGEEHLQTSLLLQHLISSDLAIQTCTLRLVALHLLR
jgi:hypothetical protein